jgi:hypothetical protein
MKQKKNLKAGGKLGGKGSGKERMTSTPEGENCTAWLCAGNPFY